MKKIKINKLPKGFHRMPDGRIMKDSDHKKMEQGGQPVLQPTSRAAANLEAEKGETVVTDLDNNNIPEHYKIGGKKHSEGGTPLNLPPKSFIFSDHKSMSIKGDTLKKFIPGTKKKSMTPAQIAGMKQFDLSEDNAVLKDENADAMAKATAERNIQSKLVKLGELAMEQEGKKDFEGGIPEIALPFLKRNGVTPEQVEMINAEIEQADMMENMMAAYGKQTYQGGGQPTIGNFTKDYSGFESFITSPDFEPLLDAAYQAYLEKNPGDSAATKEDVLQALLKMQKTNYTFKEKEMPIDQATWDNEGSADENVEYNKAVDKYGLDKLSPIDIERAQGMALTLTGLATDSRFADNPLAKRIRYTAEGEEGALSNIDGIYGDNTAKTLLSLADVEVEPEKAPIAPGTIDVQKKERQPIGPYPEDVVNLSAVMATRIPREFGYTQRLQPFLVDPTLLDPERELQANQEVANTLSTSAALQSRGQSLNANLSLLQGKLAANQANTLARYNNANVQLVNQYNVANADAMNKFAEYNAAQNRQQRIDNATLNESYTAQRNQKIENLSEAINQLTNNQRIQEFINELPDNFAYNPMTGDVIVTGSPLPTADALSKMDQAKANAAASMPQTKNQDKARMGGERFRSDLLKRFIK